MPWPRARSEAARHGAFGRALPRWQGLGLRGLVLLCLLSVVGALALYEMVERRVAAPACREHAAVHGLLYKGIDVHGPRQDVPGPRCVFAQPDGSTIDLALQRVLPWHTDLWVSFAMDIEFTIPALTVLTGLAWLGLTAAWRRSSLRGR